MEHQMIAALVLTERRVERDGDARSVHDQHRRDAQRARERAFAARARTERWMRMRAALARGIRRVAEAVEPPRVVRVARASDPC